MCASRVYDPFPCYPCADGDTSEGWSSLCERLPSRGYVLAIDGPQILDWDAVVAGFADQWRQRGADVEVLDVRDHMAPWEQILKRTAPAEMLADDPDFATIPRCTLSDFFDKVPDPPCAERRLALVIGPGAALVAHDELWYADLPKRYAEAAVNSGEGRNLGQPAGGTPPTTRRLFYVDWPLLDRHRELIADSIDCWIDVQDAGNPRWLSGWVLRASLRALCGMPFRTRPTFNTTSWGGHWAQERLRFNPEARNTALGYELIAPESGILLGSAPDRAIEVPFQLLVGLHPVSVLGPEVHERFGTSFPIRFDYLDTFGGTSLSVHCHPQADYMRNVFGWPYTQHESYYIMLSEPGNLVYLGLRGDGDLGRFEKRAREAVSDATAFDIQEFVQTFPADPHQLFLIPAGTPHGSGAGNVVLEVSATPYLYSLRFYDWLREDAEGVPRPVHVGHAFRNLDVHRRGPQVRQDLVQQARTIDSGPGWRLESIGQLPEMFFEVQRVVLDAHATARQDMEGRFHVLNLVEGNSVTIRTPAAATGWREHSLAYAETVVIPAAVGHYEVTAEEGARLVRAVVR
jgi:mannose-6-phosphate isomerase class I